MVRARIVLAVLLLLAVTSCAIQEVYDTPFQYQYDYSFDFWGDHEAGNVCYVLDNNYCMFSL